MVLVEHDSVGKNLTEERSRWRKISDHGLDGHRSCLLRSNPRTPSAHYFTLPCLIDADQQQRTALVYRCSLDHASPL